MSGRNGTHRHAVANGPRGWTATEGWTSNGLKPYFNDIVVHNCHPCWFDGGILSCIDLQDGKRKWKGGRYVLGHFIEIARVPAMEARPRIIRLLAGDILLVRNGQEMSLSGCPARGLRARSPGRAALITSEAVIAHHLLPIEW